MAKLSLAYECDQSLLPDRLAAAFTPLHCDEDTRRWIEDSQQRPHGALAMGAWKLLRSFMSDFDANGVLGTHDMFVLSTAQWRTILDATTPLRVLDIGAGDGAVTETLSSLADSITTTETSAPMARRLRRRGWVCHEVDLIDTSIPNDEKYDRVLVLNVIDRTDRPLTLLERARDLVAEGGSLTVCAPLPLQPHVQLGADRKQPSESLPAAADSWELAASDLATFALEPIGLRVTKLARAPYLCRGSGKHPVAELDLAIFVCEPC